MIDITLIDDDTQYLQIITSLIRQSLFDTDIEYRINDYENIDSFIKSNREPDIAFLDIEIGNDNGIELAKYLRLKNMKTVVIFITAYEGYIKESFGTNIFGFILKSDLTRELPIVLNKLIEEHKNNYLLQVNCFTEKITIHIKDIIAVVYESRHLYLVSKRKTYEISYSSLKKFMELLNDDFVFVNNKVIVNMHHIKSISNQKIQMNEINTCYDISKRKQNEFNNLYNDFLLKRGKKWF